MKKVLFICENPPHPIHEKFAKSIKADFFYFEVKNIFEAMNRIRKIPKNYDVYLTEGLYNYIPLIKKIGRVNEEAKFINLFSDPRLFQIIENKKFEFKTKKVKKYHLIRKFISIINIKNLDGAICVGKFETNLLKKIAKKIPIKTVYAFVDKNMFSKSNPNFKQNNMLFIGNGPDYHYKGVDFLIKIFMKLDKRNLKLFIIGSEWNEFKKKYVRFKNIYFLGKRSPKEIKKYIKNSSLYCHFGRGESWGVSILEAMTSGLPCIVSNQTGTKEVVEKVDKKFVTDMKEERKIVELILNYFERPVKEKLRLGKKFKKESSFFNEKNCLNIFKVKFAELLKEIK